MRFPKKDRQREIDPKRGREREREGREVGRRRRLSHFLVGSKRAGENEPHLPLALPITTLKMGTDRQCNGGKRVPGTALLVLSPVARRRMNGGAF